MYHNIRCPHCGYVFATEESNQMSEQRSHDWRLIITNPPHFIREHCSICGQERDPELEKNIEIMHTLVNEYEKKRKTKK